MVIKLISVALTSLLLFELGQSYNKVCLSGKGWQVTNANGTISVPALVPGTVHVALINAGMIQDPYYRFNEIEYQWVALDNWTWTKKFTVRNPDMFSGTHAVVLEFDSIDTVGEVFLNGQMLGKFDDMHSRISFQVSDGLQKKTPLLLPGEHANYLEIRIVNALAIARARDTAHPYHVPITHFYNTWDDNETTGVFSGSMSSSRNFVRKTSSDFGWDWGPAFIPQGIPGDVSLLTFSTRLLPDFTVHQQHEEDGTVALTVSAKLHSPQEQHNAGVMNVSVALSTPHDSSRQTVAHTSFTLDHLSAGSSPVDLQLKILAADVHLWWPVGYGNASLYNVTVTFTDAQEKTQTAISRMGLRRVRLITDPVPPNRHNRTGETFFFELNGVEIYAKGANWIPADAFDRDTAETWKWLLASGRDSNMNMVRVWGGGKFMADEFYQYCDEMGIMVWQEMMFGCALYPTDVDFLARISSEVKDAVARLQTHPSIVIWGGNNENEGALTWYDESWNDRPFYQADYVKLYIDTVYAALQEADPELILPAGHSISHKNGGRTWVDSSPSNGLLSQDAHDKRWGSVGNREYGDLHYYNYDDDCEDFTTYPEGRFISEHGFQSWPAFTLLESVTAQQDWSRESTWFGYRQRHQQGNEQMLGMMAKHLPVPPAYPSDPQLSQKFVFDTYLYLTQVQQARCYETAISQWRRLKGDPLVKTMGVLYWQMNDIWQGPSWSSMEYDGRWRVVQYAVQRAYAPLLLSSYERDDVVHVHLTSDSIEPLRDLTLKVHLHAWGSATADPTASWNYSGIRLWRLGSKEIAALPVNNLLNGSRTDFFLRIELQDATGGIVTERAFHWLTTFGNANLPASVQKIESVMIKSADSAEVIVSSDRTAIFVLLETSGGPLWAGKFSENAFTLLPGESKTVTFTARHGRHIDINELKSKIQVRSLSDAWLGSERMTQKIWI